MYRNNYEAASYDWFTSITVCHNKLYICLSHPFDLTTKMKPSICFPIFTSGGLILTKFTRSYLRIDKLQVCFSQSIKEGERIRPVTFLLRWRISVAQVRKTNPVLLMLMDPNNVHFQRNTGQHLIC